MPSREGITTATYLLTYLLSLIQISLNNDDDDDDDDGGGYSHNVSVIARHA